ncbi:MAG: peptidase [Rhodoferax sp.]|nr:peptidase [Rhodoferax sp.]NCP54302.1 peptidase [Rhodoferax sp.]OIP22566.1 MAG: hypothetical protein AUK52_05915 [Comamonadaceae bacterium CG2_30_60_41]PIW06650.1 MAG: peptidase [Comamonadaceae bacterium CG17_big_fil_post_rev_8_21_14_2_50_60_13]
MKFSAPWIFALLLAVSAPVWADVGREEAAVIAQKATSGRVLAVDQIQRDGRALWRVKLVTPQGEVRVVFIDVTNGRAR